MQRANYLLFQKVPIVETDRMKLVQTWSILPNIAEKQYLIDKDLKVRTDGLAYVGRSGSPGTVHNASFLKSYRHQQRKFLAWPQGYHYFLVFEKILRGHGQDLLVDNQHNLAVMILPQTILTLGNSQYFVCISFPLEVLGTKQPHSDEIFERNACNIFIL